MQNERGEAGAVGDEAAAKSGEEPSAEAEEEEGEADESTERREIVKMADPREPTEDERREHNLTRLPFRSWRPTVYEDAVGKQIIADTKNKPWACTSCTLISCRWEKRTSQDKL